EPGPVARKAHEDVDRLVSNGQAGELLEPERLVELDRPVDVADPVAGVDELAHERVTLASQVRTVPLPPIPARPIPDLGRFDRVYHGQNGPPPPGTAPTIR